MSPKVRKLVKAECEKNAQFALRVAEAGFGRPPQALEVSMNKLLSGESIEFTATYADGEPVPAAALNDTCSPSTSDTEKDADV